MRKGLLALLAASALAGCGSSTPQTQGGIEPAPRESPAVQKALTESPREEEALCIRTGGSRAECDTNRTATEIEDAEGKPR